MTDRPILFSAPMIRAILREIDAPGTGKTQTRRLAGLEDVNESPETWQLRTTGPLGYMAKPSVKGRFGATFERRQPEPATLFICPQILPYTPGDRLWVRETWAVGNIYDGVAPRDINPYGKPGWCGIRYAASHSRNGIFDRPSIHMPRWASRLTLTVTDVRVQRLQDISGDDARAEGIEQVYDPGADDDAPAYLDYRIPDHAFAGFGAARLSLSTLWDSLNTKPGTGWADNPWVAAITFVPRLGNIDGEGM